MLLQNPIHRANRAEVGSLVQKRSPHLSGRLVDEPLTVQGPEDFLALSFVESSVRPRTTLRFGRHRLAPAIQRGTSHTQSLAGFRRLPNPPRQLLGRHDQSFWSLSSGFRGIPSSSEVFFWISNIVSTRARRRWSRAFSRSSSLTRGSSAFALRPRSRRQPCGLAFSTAGDANSIIATSTSPLDAEEQQRHRHPCRHRPHALSAACTPR